MNSEDKRKSHTEKRNERTLLGLALAAITIIGLVTYYSYTMTSKGTQDSAEMQGPISVRESFQILSGSHTDVCAYLGDRQANTNYIDSLADDFYLQGSCCAPMDYSHYVSQVTALKNYSSIPIIPRDPYNVSASLAKQMISYDTAALTPSQQAVLDNALKASSEGPCCCQCWAWYAHEGLAKALITQYGWNGQQIAKLWSLEDCCGGP